MAGDPYSVRGKSMDELLGMLDDAGPGSAVHERAKVAIFARGLKDLVDASARRATIAAWIAAVSAAAAIASAAAAFLR